MGYFITRFVCLAKTNNRQICKAGYHPGAYLELLLGDKTLSGEYEDDFNKAEKYCDKMNQLSAELEYAVKKSLNKPQSEAEISQGNARKFKLPKLELTRFNGDTKDFLNFWSQFEKIHIDSNIHDDDKMHYLIQCSVPGSKIFKLVSSFPPTKENYRNAVQKVKERFDREDKLVQIYIRDLFSYAKCYWKDKAGAIRTL
ncbi:putative RNA-directed DNA polymerase from transposon X-element [Trichonephila clavipes]|nr:putative RNA-directed DNA polymerase from transposon X-element [Trichonephila clavipes]